MLNSRYTTVKAPFGTLFLTAEDNRLIRITPEKPPALDAMQNDDNAVLTQTAAAISKYFCANRDLTFAIPDNRFSPFQREVYDFIRRIPYGQVISSTHVASLIEKPHAVRAVEDLCRNNPYWVAIPCHRVILYGENRDRSAGPLSAAESLRRLEKRYYQNAPTS